MSSSSGGRPRAAFPSPWVIAAALLGVATLAVGATSVWGLADPNAPAKNILPLAAAHEARADALLRTGGAVAETQAEAEARQALAQGPARAVNWLQVAFADSAAHGRLTRAGLSALSNSYVFQPMGPEIIEWRLDFALNHWAELTPALRRQVRQEARALWTTDGQPPVKRALRNPHPGEGGPVAALMLLQLKATERK